jgi:ectoine hydroxylase-related dioxygenase (phytanoyl-CoA dioxygenase family)
VLEQLPAIRIDLDGSDLANGDRRVLPASHALGLLQPERIAAIAQTVPAVTSCVRAGGALCLSPRLVHASSRATEPRHRRIVHLEFSARELPGGLAFAQHVQ